MISYFQSVRERPSENKKEHIMEIVVKQNEDGKWEGKLLVDVHESLNLDWIQFAR